MSRLTDAIDANRRGEAVPPRTQTPKNNAMGTGSREERATSRAPSPVPLASSKANPTGQSRLEQAIDASRRGETVRPGTYTPPQAIVPNRYYRPVAVGTEPAQSQKPTEKPRKATLYDMTIGSIKRGYDNAIYGRELYKDMTGQENQADEYAQKMAGDEYNFEADGFLTRALSGGMEQIGQWVRQWTDPLSVGLAGTAATGAAIAGQAGPQVLVPEEVITVPGAFMAGLQVGSTKANFEIEAGHAYKEMLDNGISEETASKIATGVGIGNAALEFVQLDELAKSFKILDKIGADDSIIGAVKRELTRRGVDIAKETAQEVAQEGVTIAGTQIGSKIDTGKWAYNSGDVLSRLGDTAASSALSFGALNVPGGAYNVYQQTSGKDTQNAGGKSAEDIGATFQEMGDDVVLATIQEGLASDPSTRSYQLAQQLQQKLDAGETVTNAELGHLYQANVQAIDAEENSDDLLLRAADEVAHKGGVTNSTATDILGNPSAVRTLAQDAGLSLADDMSKAQRRKAVKTAVETLASRNTATTEASVETNMEQATPSPAAPQSVPVQQRPMAAQAYDIRRVQSAAASMGERGAKALRAAYDGSVSADTFYAGFASYYEAGVSGMDMGKVRSEYGAQLSAAQKYAAYVAGQNDAELSLQRERQAAPYAKSAGSDSGLVYDDFVRQAVESGRVMDDVNGETRVYLTAETAAKINGVAKSLGVRVQFVDSVRGGTANAQISGSTVLVERNNPNPVMAIVGHEMTHRMQELAPKEYRAFRDIVAQEEQSGIQRRIDAYAAQGVELTYEQAMDEVAADYAGRMIDDGKVLDDFIEKHRDDRTLLEKVRDAIRAIVRKLTGAEKKQAQTAEGKLTAALEAAAKQAENLETNKNAAQTDGETKFSIKRTSQMTLAQQLKMFYDGKMASSDAFYFGETPAALEKSGFDALPLAMTIGDFRKSTQTKHNIPRRVLKNLMNNLADPLFSFGSGDRAGIILDDIDGDGHKLLAALERGTTMDRKPVNVINSLYGLEHPAEWLKNQIDSGNEFVLYDEKRANAFLQTYGYSASVGDGIRSMGESVTQNGTEVKTKFSLKAPVEETRDLLALHNKDERSILAALELGGLPMPSIAVVKAEQGHTKYGPISLVFSKDTIDPEFSRANKVYGGDAWTPTAPQVDYPVNSKKAAQIERELHRLSGDASVAGGIFGSGSTLRSVGIEDTSARNTAELAEKLASTDAVRAAYLADQGKTLEPVKMDKVWDKFGNDTLQRVINRLGADTLAEMEANLEMGESAEIALGENAETIRDIIRDYYQEKNEPMLRRMAARRHWTEEEINEKRQTRIDSSMDGVSIFTLEDIVRHAWDMYQDGGNTKGEIDRMATSDALRSAVDDHAVEEWIVGKLDGLLGDAGIYNGKEPYTPSGNRRSFSQLHYAYTLENIVKAMKEGQEERGGNTWGASAKTLQSVATPEYRSIQEIKADSGRLGMDEGAEYEAKLQAIDEQIDNIITKVKQSNSAHSDNPFIESDIIGGILMETSKGKRTVDAIMRTFSKEGYKISSQTAQDIQAVYRAAAEMPTGYFEAKPRRAVGFDEVLAAVIPDDSSQKLRDALADNGVTTIDYKAGDDADRIAKVNSVEGARFSLKEDSEGRELTKAQQEYFQDSKVLDGQGRLKVMYRGGNGDFTVFDRKKSSYSNLYGRGFYFTDSEAHARQYGSARSFYLNITNPVPTAETTITRAQMRKFLKAVAENEDDFSFENYGYGATVDSVLKSVYGKSDFAMLYDVSQTAIGDMVAAVELFNEVNGTGFDGLVLDTETVAFRSNQIKNTDNLAPTGDPDIRYSLKEDTVSKNYAAILEENELLREQMKDYIDLQRRNGKLQESRDYWQGQTRRTKRVTTDKKAVSRAARELIRSYGADLDAGDITQDLQSLYDYLASGYDGKDELTYTEARRRAEAIAEKLAGNAVAVDETYEQYSDLRAYLRSTTLSLSEEDSRDIPDYGDWRKHQMGRMVIRKGHTNIDQVYQEMSELWPEFFDEQRENNPVDQLLRIAEVMDGIYNVEEYNPFGPYMQQAITGAANEIMERFFDLPQTRATFADRQARKLDDTKAKGRERVQKVREQNAARLAELRQQNRERTAKAVERERTRRVEQIGKLKQRHREKDAVGQERRSARELRAKIMRHASALSQKLLRPSDKQHIPESLRQAVAAMLDSINLESAYTTDPNTGKRVKDGSGTPTKRTEAFRALRLAYAEIAKDGGDYTLIIDPDLMDNLNELEAMKNTPIAEMGTDQLATVWATLKAVEASIRTANKMLGTSRFETISGFADGIRSDNILRQDRGDYRGVAGKVDRLVNLDMLTPQGYFHRLGKTGEELFRMMRAAQDHHITIMQQAQEKTAEIVGKTDVNKLEREKHTFELSGGKVTMSTAQIMGLYELMKRKQAQDHILKGGIRPDTISSGRGLREDRRSDPVKVSVDDLATITGTLTEEQIRIADGLQKFMGGKLAELGNEASMAVYGYRKFTEKDYYPIKVDKNQTKRDISKEAQAATIAGRGFTKSVTPKANNAVMVESIFDTYSSHVNDMATYAAWLPTMENIRRIRDFTFRDGEGNRTGDVKSIIERVFGKNGNAYLNKLVDDINQGVRPNGTGNFTDALVGNYKAAAVAANIRVILQQPTAILRAMSSLDPKYLLAGTVKRGDWAKVKKYAPIAVWKDWGYFDINTGRQMKDVLLSSDSLMEKVKQAAMAGAGKADSFAWARLWNAADAETRDKRPGLKPGTEAFYQAVGARFSEIVDQTQVVDGLLQRSQIMRSPDALTKMATSFMAEPTKTYNMFVNAVYDLRHATGKDGRSNAKRALARTSAALVVSFAVNAVMQSIVDALRDDDKERDYWEKFLTAYTGFTGEEETALDYWNSFWDGNLEANFNPAGYIPYFKDLVSIMQGYDVSRMDMEPVSKVLEAAANMKKALSGEGKYSVAGASANLLAEVSRLLGIPVANLKRDIQAGITTAAIETDNYLMQYRIDKALLNMGYQGNTKNFYDILYNASINDRGAYETIYADMVASGMPEDKIRNAMESRMKRDQGVESVGDLEQRYLSPSQERRYNSTRNSMAGSSVWTAASRDQQEAAEKDLYDLTVGNDSGEKLQEKIAAGAAYGISEADYLLYRLALHVADQPTENGNLGSYTGEEVQTAIDMLPGLDDEARAYLWEAAGKSEKSNPYK